MKEPSRFIRIIKRLKSYTKLIFFFVKQFIIRIYVAHTLKRFIMCMIIKCTTCKLFQIKCQKLINTYILKKLNET